jgi:hypothetical protein
MSVNISKLASDVTPAKASIDNLHLLKQALLLIEWVKAGGESASRPLLSRRALRKWRNCHCEGVEDDRSNLHPIDYHKFEIASRSLP